MEDRYQAHKVLYLIGLLSMLSCLACMMFGLYILWPLLTGVQRSVPDFIFDWRDYLMGIQKWKSFTTACFIFMFFITIAAISGAVAYWVAHQLDKRVLPMPSSVESVLSKESLLQQRHERREFLWVIAQLFTSLALLGLILWSAQLWMLKGIVGYMSSFATKYAHSLFNGG